MATFLRIIGPDVGQNAPKLNFLHPTVKEVDIVSHNRPLAPTLAPRLPPNPFVETRLEPRLLSMFYMDQLSLSDTVSEFFGG